MRQIAYRIEQPEHLNSVKIESINNADVQQAIQYIYNFTFIYRFPFCDGAVVDK